jgi:histidyl-tRNA synthetase
MSEQVKKEKKQFQTPKGTFDILASDQKYWEKIRLNVDRVARDYSFDRIDTPIIENAELFTVGVGEQTDIVEKQMFIFRTKGRDLISLRPEGTSPIARAYIQNGLFNLPQPQKLYYIGPFFRYEQPQAGRYRQFHQFGFEILGESDAIYDAQLVRVFLNVAKNIGLKNLLVAVNSIGDKHCRPAYRKQLIQYYRNKANQLCKDCKLRFRSNPLRLLDCKNEACVALKANAPHMVDNLCEDCHNHFKLFLEYLDELKVPYILNPHLVRGLDYYTRSVFEFYSESDDKDRKTQLDLGGGGRYDGLVKLIGGKDTPAVGFAAGIERLIALMKATDIKISESKQPQVFVVQLGELGKKKGISLFENLKDAGIKVAESFGRDSIKSQLKIADKLGVAITLIMGQKEALDGTVIIKDMESGTQEILPLEKIIDELKKRFKKQ